jgi:hypothetical protein
METASDINSILSAVGLQREMTWQAGKGDVYDPTKFRNYVSSEYQNSPRKETDEVYRMFEITLLHIETGLRFTYVTTENYDGDTVEYKLKDIFIITPLGQQLTVREVNFSNKKCHTTDGKFLSFRIASKQIP